jgi:hypothetical protein
VGALLVVLGLLLEDRFKELVLTTGLQQLLVGPRVDDYIGECLRAILALGEVGLVVKELTNVPFFDTLAPLLSRDVTDCERGPLVRNQKIF